MRALFHVLVLLLALPCTAADRVVPFPEGYTADEAHWGRSPLTSAPGMLAIALHDADSCGSRVLQVRDDTSSVTDTELPGHVSFLEASRDGARVLAHHVTSAGERIVTMLDRSGRTLWSRDDARLFFFSTTGETLVAFTRPEPLLPIGHEVEIFDVAGASLRRVSFQDWTGPERWLMSIQLVGQGDSAIVATRREVARLALDPQPRTIWELESGSVATDITAMRALTTDLVFVHQVMGRFLVLDLRGTVRYDHAGMDSYHAWPTADPDVLAVFDGTRDVFLLHVAAGRVERRRVHGEIPSEAFLREVFDGRMVLVGPSALHIRTMDLVPR